MIEYRQVNIELWKRERILHKNKVSNYVYLQNISNIISKVVSKYSNLNGVISYKNDDDFDNIKLPFLYYNYGSPISQMCKLLPNGYGFTKFLPNDFYKNFNSIFGLHNLLYKLYDKGNLTRYKQPTNYEFPNLPEEYILVIMQNTNQTFGYKKNFTKLANEIIAWSRESKRNILFKWHFGCIDHLNPSRWWDELNEKSNFSYFDYTTPLNILIKNCNMVWTASSMAGIESLICNKPVSIFGQTEYMEMTTVSNSPEEAINAKVPDDLEQWLTYYFKHYCVNIFNKNAENIIENRILNFFEKDMSLIDFFKIQ